MKSLWIQPKYADRDCPASGQQPQYGCGGVLLLAGFSAVLLTTGCSKFEDTALTVDPVKPRAGEPIKPDNATIMTTSQLVAKADVPIYKGADLPEGESTVKSSEEGTRYEIIMSCHDMPDSVLHFYEHKLSHGQIIPGGTTVMGMSPKGHYVSVKAWRTGDRTDIDIVVTDETAAGRNPAAG